MAFLLDTVTLSELRKQLKADPRVLAWQRTHPGRGYVSVITLNEICFGIRRVEGKDAPFAERLKIWYNEILAAKDLFSLVPVDREIAETGADLRYEFQMAYDDALIAATARVRGLTLATRNVSDFQATGISLMNPWAFQG